MPLNDSPSHSGPPGVVVVGAASRDRVTDDPRGWRLGGAVSYGALAIARLGLRVAALVGADAEAAEAEELETLREAGVDVRVAALASGPVFENIEGPGGRRQVAYEAADPVAGRGAPARVAFGAGVAARAGGRRAAGRMGGRSAGGRAGGNRLAGPPP